MATQTLKCLKCGDKGGTITVSGDPENGPRVIMGENVTMKCFICRTKMQFCDIPETKKELGHENARMAHPDTPSIFG